MAKHKISDRVRNMIYTDYLNDKTAAQSAARINKSATARKEGIKLTPTSVRSVMAWFTINNT